MLNGTLRRLGEQVESTKGSIKFTNRVLGTLLVVLVGCSTQQGVNDLILDRLKNRGPVALSSSNPYLVPNVYIQKEMDRSSELKGFVKLRGVPKAISVEKEIFGEPSLEFYYPGEHEYYRLDKQADTWLISGPFKLQAENERVILAAIGAEVASPQATIDFKTPAAPLGDRSSEVVLAQSSGKTDAAEIAAPFTSPAIPSGDSPTGVTEEAWIKSIVAKTGAEDAEQSPQGDLVHYVTYPGETLSMISRWYTFDVTNAPKIARINKLKNPEALSVGDSIVLPKYLVKNKKRLTENGVSLLKLPFK